MMSNASNLLVWDDSSVIDPWSILSEHSIRYCSATVLHTRYGIAGGLTSGYSIKAIVFAWLSVRRPLSP